METIELTLKEFEEMYLEYIGQNIRGGCKCKLKNRIKRLSKKIGKTIIVK